MDGEFIQNYLCRTNAASQSRVSSYLAGLNSTRCFVNNKSLRVVCECIKGVRTVTHFIINTCAEQTVNVAIRDLLK